MPTPHRQHIFSTEGEVRQDIATAEPFTGTVWQTVTSALGHAIHEVDDYAWFRGGRNLVESTLFAGAYSRTYTLQGIRSLGNEKLTVVFTGDEVATPLTIWANGATVAMKNISAPGNYMYYSEGKYINMDVKEFSAGDTWKITLATQGAFATDSRVQGRLDYTFSTTPPCWNCTMDMCVLAADTKGQIWATVLVRSSPRTTVDQPALPKLEAAVLQRQRLCV